jgi:hypothetical protein
VAGKGTHPFGRQSLLQPKAYSYIYSAVTSQYTDQNPFMDNEEFRLGPLEARDFPILLDSIAQFFFYSVRFQVATEECGAAQAGTISISANGSVVTGLATAFISALRMGQTIWVADDAGTLRFFQIASIASATTMQIKSSAVSAITAQAYGLAQSGQIPFQSYNAYGAAYAANSIQQLSGTFTLTAAANTVAGVGTQFVAELAVGSKFRLVDDTGALQHYVIDTITNATTATIKGLAVNNATAVTASRWFADYGDLQIDLHGSGGARGITLFDKIPLRALQGKNGGGSVLLLHRRYNRDFAKSGDGPVPVAYLFPPGGALTMRVYNRANDTRYFHGHLFGSAIKT